MARKKIAVIDAETDPFEVGEFPQPFLWGYYDGKRYEQFDKTRHLISFLKKTNAYIYAHNGGRFDYHFLLDYAERGRPVKVINGRLAQWYLGKATMLDSLLILPVSLSKMQKDVFDYTKMHRDCRHRYMPEIARYLKHDCEYLYNYVMRFIDDYGQNLTLAGAAMSFWSKLTGTDKPINKSDTYYNNLKPYYYGGRVTFNDTGIFKGKFDVYDINSAYPFVMKTINHPWGFKTFETARPLDHQLNRCFITLECQSNGALPARHKTGIDFPHRKMVYNITGHEFKAALKTNSISDIKILKCIVYEDTINFSQYVDYFYNLKKNAKKKNDKAGYLLAKLFMNSLYGKFGSNPQTYKNYTFGEYGEKAPVYTVKDSEGDPLEKYWEYGACLMNCQIFQRPLEPYEQTFYNVATSASITGAVRAYLWEHIQKVDGFHYSDTDSIICQSGKGIKLGDELGQWDLEAKGNKLAIAGKKLYALWKLDGSFKIASKGVQLNAQEIERVARGETVTWEKQAPVYTLSGEPYHLKRAVKLQNKEILWQ